MSEEFSIVHYTDLEAEPFTESSIEHWKLTEPLGATEIESTRSNSIPARRSIHTHTSARRRSTSR